MQAAASELLRVTRWQAAAFEDEFRRVVRQL